jgi:hypothetical protein
MTAVESFPTTKYIVDSFSMQLQEKKYVSQLPLVTFPVPSDFSQNLDTIQLLANTASETYAAGWKQ